MPLDDNINIGPAGAGGVDNYIIKSYYEQDDTAASCGHYQLMGLAFDDNSGGTWDIVSTINPYPVKIPSGSVVGGYIQDLTLPITGDGTDGNTAFNINILDSSGITVNASIDSLVLTDVGATAFGLGVYGTGATAISVTGNIGIGASEMITISGDTAITGSVYVRGSADVWSTTGISVFGTGGTAMGVTGQVAVDDTSLIGISGGITVDAMPSIDVNLSTSITHGVVEGAALNAGLSLGGHTLSSGVKITAFHTGVSTDYIYVGGETSTGLASTGYPLREFDSVFIEVDNLYKVCLICDNASAAECRFIGS